MQAVNDFVIFTVAGIGSLLSGVIYSSFSWAVLVYMSAALVSSRPSFTLPVNYDVLFFHAVICVFFSCSKDVRQLDDVFWSV